MSCVNYECLPSLDVPVARTLSVLNSRVEKVRSAFSDLGVEVVNVYEEPGRRCFFWVTVVFASAKAEVVDKLFQQYSTPYELPMKRTPAH